MTNEKFYFLAALTVNLIWGITVLIVCISNA